MSDELAGTTEETVEAVEEVVAAAKRDRKLEKSVEGTVVTINALGGAKGAVAFDASTLPQNVQDALIPFGLSHKLGDAAAGRTGADAEEAIQKVWEGLVAGDWSVRTPAAPKIKITEVKNALANMSDEEATAARELMKKLGINVG
jgi:hypothetical protein